LRSAQTSPTGLKKPKSKKGKQMVSVKKALKESHKILGLVFCVFIVIIGITGALYSYARDIIAYEKTARFYDRDKTPFSAGELASKFLEQNPNVNVRYIALESLKKDLPFITIYADDNGAWKSYNIDPYSGEATAEVSISGKIFSAILSLHTSFSPFGSSAIGKQITAVSTIAVIFLSVIGFILYLPSLKRNFLKSLRIDFKAKGYKFLYQLHCVLGVLTIAFVLTMSLTGLWWSYEWYRNALYNLAGVKPERQMDSSGKPYAKPTQSQLQRILDIAASKMGKSDIVALSVPFEDEPYFISYWTYKYGHVDEIKIDAQNVKTVSVKLHENKTIGERFIDSIYALHTGQFFGEIGKALWCVSSLSMALFGVSGAMMFYRRIRRPRKNTPPIALRFLKAQA
jgi:sulfite reductase (NADPH) flavoprotein alpha-component